VYLIFKEYTAVVKNVPYLRGVTLLPDISHY